MSMEFENMVRCINCKKEFHENEVIYDGDEDMEFCPYCGEGETIRDIITIANIVGLLDKYHKKYELLNDKFIRLYSEDGSYTGVEVSSNGSAICYEGKIIGGLSDLEKRL